MKDTINTKFIFKKQEYQIFLQPQDCKNLSQEILSSLLIHHQYEIQSNVIENVFQSVIDYLNNRSIPKIKNEDIDEYEILNKELQIIQISNFIEQKRNFFKEILNDITNLSNNSITDKSEIEHKISKNLDDYMQFGNELINAPVQSLFNIFYYKDKNFTEHNRLYELIKSNFQKTKKSEIFILLQFIDGNLIEKENLIDSIRNEKDHFGFKPKFDLLLLFNRIQELEELNKIHQSELNKNEQNKLNENQQNELKENLQNKLIENLQNKLNENQRRNMIENQHNELNENQQSEINNNQQNKLNENQQNNIIENKQNNLTENQQINIIENQQNEPNENQHNNLTENQQSGKNENQQNKSNENENQQNNFTENQQSQINENEQKNLTENQQSTLNEHQLNNLIENQHNNLTENQQNEPNENQQNNLTENQQNEPNENQQNNLTKNRQSEKNESHHTKLIEKQIQLKLDRNKHIAEVTFPNTKFEKVFVPRKIVFRSNEYLIKGIGQYTSPNTSIKSITFQDDSEIDSLNFDTINCELLETVTIPSRVERILFGINKYEHLTNIIVSDSNKYFTWFENSFLLGKSDKRYAEYDLLVFARRNIEHAKIPPSIKRICPYCFYNCKNLKTIEFLSDKNLGSIGSYAFYSTSIETIQIPMSVALIGNFALFSCSSLHQIELKINSTLKSIGSFAFYSNPIKSIVIPNTVKEIGDYAFSSCSNLQTVYISQDSKLRSIGKSVFYSSPVSTIEFPSKLKKLADSWSVGLYNLTKITVDPSNQHFTWFDNNFLLGKSNQNIEDFDVLVFARKDIEQAKIPSNIKHISPFCFYGCSKLKIISFQSDSLLLSIGNGAFHSTSIETIEIPQHVTTIGDNAFSLCTELEKVKFDENSELQMIGKRAFYSTSFESINIPPHVKTIGDYAFSSCKRLINVKFTDDSELCSLGDSSFDFPFIKSIEFPPNYQILPK